MERFPNFENSPSKETPEQKNKRYAGGQITESEIFEYQKNPDSTLFEHELSKKMASGAEYKIKFQVKSLTKNSLEKTLEGVSDSWDDVSFENLKETLKLYFEQKESGIPGLLNAEYYIAVDGDDMPIAMTGLYSVDIQGTSGFATRNELDPKKHNMILGLGWFSVSKKIESPGMGKYLLDWTENLARTRGANFMEIETDDWDNSKMAVALYRRSGYQEGHPVKDYYGAGRDLNAYYFDAAGELESEPVAPSEITRQDVGDLLKIAAKINSPDRVEEFKVCLELFLKQQEDKSAILSGKSLVLRDASGHPESFAIYSDGIYDNELLIFWEGADPERDGARERLISKLKETAKSCDQNVVVIMKDKEDPKLINLGFTSAGQGIPGVFGKDDPTKLLHFIKPLNPVK
ncbi:MAG: hypothetical protein ABR875_01340 [Minisyncoccia bacterium]|jgi:GNAT superfamily N-acetyltransferase